MNKGVILIVGDSTALPREEVSYIDTWPHLLKKKLSEYDIENISKWGETTNSLTGREKLEWYKPKIVILQLGICDCAPRLMTKIEKKILYYLPSKISKLYISIIKKIRPRSTKRACVDSDDYMRNIYNYINRAKTEGVKKIYILGILNSGKKYRKNNPNIQKSIDIYNKILIDLVDENDICDFIKMDLSEDEVDKITIEDGFHYNIDGHKYIYSQLSERIILEY